LPAVGPGGRGRRGPGAAKDLKDQAAELADRVQALRDLLGGAGAHLHLDNDQADAALLVLGAALALARAADARVRAAAGSGGR
jgi:hypothetical protein